MEQTKIGDKVFTIIRTGNDVLRPQYIEQVRYCSYTGIGFNYWYHWALPLTNTVALWRIYYKPLNKNIHECC